LHFLQKLVEWIVIKDKQLFIFINSKCSNTFFDSILPWCRESTNWVWLYILLIIIVVKKLKIQSYKWVLGAIITVAISDQISSTIIKNLVCRLRPCSDVLFSSQVKLLLHHCSSGYSFTSSHACNHFAIASFMVISLKKISNSFINLWFLWAAIIAFAQVYVGVHYPLDVFCGALLGCGIGTLLGKFYLNKIQ
jgi:membrane-associated phospholipid phosphatase